MPSDPLFTRLSDLEARLSMMEANVQTLLQHAGLSAEMDAPPSPPAVPPPLPVAIPVTEEAEPLTPIYKKSPNPKVTLESRIGKNLSGWVGAIVLILAVAFFLQYAAQHGWIHPTPTTRVTLAVLAGLALAGVGEWLLRKPMRGLAATLYAAGVATIMTALFAAHAYFTPALLATTPATLLVLATAAGGIALALRANLPAMAVLSLLGAYLSPAILHANADQSLPLLSYLLLLAATAWTLCLLRPRWTGLRAFTFAASFAWYALWYSRLGHHHPTLAFAYLSLTFAGTLVELFLAVQRLPNDTRLESTCSVLSLTNTLATSAALYLLYQSNQPLAGSLALGLAAILSLVALSTPSRHLRYSSILQSAALVTLAVPLLLSHFSINLAWLVMAIALSLLNRRLNLRWPRPWAITLWLLAAVKLLAIDRFNPALRATLVPVGDHPVTHWLLIAWTSAVAAHALAFLGPRPLTNDPLGAKLAALGTFLFVVATTAAWGFGPATTLAALLWLTPIIGLRQQGGRIAYPEHAAAFLVAITLKWIFIDGLLPAVNAYTSPTSDLLPPLFNLPTLCALLLAAAFIPLGRRITHSFTALGIAAITFFLLNFELLRAVNHFAAPQPLADLQIAKQVFLSILWSVTALAAITVGFTRRLAPARYAGLSLLGLTRSKILTIDMAGVQTLWRICSFTAVGALLMCVSFVYYKHLDAKSPAAMDGQLPI